MQNRKGNKFWEDSYIFCTDPYRDEYVIIWDIEKAEDDQYTFVSETFIGKPSEDMIRSTIINYFNKKCDTEILCGHKLEDDTLVWLSDENQKNFSTAWSIAQLTKGLNLPVTYKFGTDKEPVYKTFNTVEDLDGFILPAFAHIKSVLDKYWKIKDDVDWGRYKIEEDIHDFIGN